MNLKKIKYYSTISTIFCFLIFAMSCMKESEEANQSQMLTIHAEIAESTKAAKSSFEKDDELGLFIKDSNNQDFNNCDCSFNLKSTYSGLDWQLSEAIMLNKDKATLYAYYPYNATLADCTALPIEASTQTDYLYATSVQVDATNSKATLSMQHALSLAKFKILRGEYQGPGVISRITLQQVTKNGTLNTHTGGISAGEIGHEIYSPSEELLLPNSVDPLTVDIITIPMAVTTSSVIFSIDGVDYLSKLSDSIWEAGKETTYTLSVDSDSKTLLTVEKVSIEPWGTGGSYEGSLVDGGFEVGVK